MGIVGGTSPTTDSFGATLNPFNLRSNYGTLPGDRRQIFNAVYSISLPSPLHGNRLAAGAVNGWQLSGITQLQSGANLTGNFGGYNYAMNLNGAILPGTQNVSQSRRRRMVFRSTTNPFLERRTFSSTRL